jgi:hypothetical protein
MTTYNYYYNNVPGHGLCRNNLIYTSLISEDQKEFVQWYYNDTEYHMGMNEVVDPRYMEAKWKRESKYLSMMAEEYPQHVPYIKTINEEEKKIYLEIDGPDFWEQAGCLQENYDKVLPDWREQMLEIFEAHKQLGLFKYSLHPSSYFIVDGKLKSINYFFTYEQGEGPITVREHLSHISEQRRRQMKPQTEALGIDWDEPQTLQTMQVLAFESFRNNYPSDFIEEAKCLFV